MNLTERIKMITLLGAEYPVAYSNSAKLKAKEKIEKDGLNEKDFSLEDTASFLALLINDGIRLQNFVKKENRPFVDDEEIEMLVDFTPEEELTEVLKEITEFVKTMK